MERQKGENYMSDIKDMEHRLRLLAFKKEETDTRVKILPETMTNNTLYVQEAQQITRIKNSAHIDKSY